MWRSCARTAQGSHLAGRGQHILFLEDEGPCPPCPDCNLPASCERHGQTSMTSGYIDPQDQISAIRLGVTPVLTKPFSRKKLLAALHDIFQERRELDKSQSVPGGRLHSSRKRRIISCHPERSEGSHFSLGGRSFSSDNECCAVVGLQPLRNLSSTSREQASVGKSASSRGGASRISFVWNPHTDTRAPSTRKSPGRTYHLRRRTLLAWQSIRAIRIS